MTEMEGANIICEGLLDIHTHSELDSQFYNWMKIKGVSLNPNPVKTAISNNIVRNIMEIIDRSSNSSQEYHEACFTRDGFDRGGGHDRATFDKACIP